MKRLLLAWLIIIPAVIYAANMPRISANPKVKEYNAQACKQLTAGNMDGALVSINKAIRLDSMDVISYHNKVTILMGLKKGFQNRPMHVKNQRASLIGLACCCIAAERQKETRR